MLKHQGTGIMCSLSLSSLLVLVSLLSQVSSRCTSGGTRLDVSRLSLSTLSLCESVYKIVIDKGPTTLCMRLAENDDNIESDRERGWSLESRHESRGGVSAGRDREN